MLGSFERPFRVQLFVRAVRGTEAPAVAAKALEGIIDQAQMSPDSSLVVYNGNDTGRMEVYAVPFPAAGARIRLTREGGVQPAWRADGRELYFLALDGTLMAVDVGPGPAFGDPRPIAKLGGAQFADSGIETYLPSPDGQRFLFLADDSDVAPASFSVIVTWQQLLTAAAPAR